MDALRSSFNQHAFELWLLLIVVILLVAVWLLAVQLHTRHVEARLDAIFSNADEDNGARMLADYLSTVRATAAAVNRMKAEHDQIAAIMPSVIRNVGLVRFSPFHDTGGDQSFALALLDSQGDGVVVTALHSRSDSRLYAKPVERGASHYSLTPEEREAMDRALKRAPAEARP